MSDVSETYAEAQALVEEKRAVRARVIAARDALDEEVRARKSSDVCAQLESLIADEAPGVATGGIVAVYAAMGSEVRLDEFIKAAFAQGWQVAFPCMNPKGSSPRMCMRTVSREAWDARLVPFIEHPLRRFAADADELAAFPVVEPRNITFVAVPLVAFDAEGFRLGYGGGNYDEYLGLLGDDAHIAGVAFGEQRVNAVPREAHDRKLERVVFA